MRGKVDIVCSGKYSAAEIIQDWREDPCWALEELPELSSARDEVLELTELVDDIEELQVRIRRKLSKANELERQAKKRRRRAAVLQEVSKKLETYVQQLTETIEEKTGQP